MEQYAPPAGVSQEDVSPAIQQPVSIAKSDTIFLLLIFALVAKQSLIAYIAPQARPARPAHRDTI